MFRKIIPELNVKAITIKNFNEDCKGMPVVIAPGFFTDGDEDWVNKLIKVIDSPIVFAQWRSSNFYELLKGVMLKLITSFVLPYRFSGIPLLIGNEFYSKWRECSALADDAGKELAIFLNNIWTEGDKALFIGHSLGVRVITEAMKGLKSNNVFSSVSIAGAILKDKYEKSIIQARCVDDAMHINLYSDCDYVLSYLYKVGELDISNKPIGIIESGLNCVDSINLNLGHTSYLTSKIFLRYITMYYREKRSEYYARY